MQREKLLHAPAGEFGIGQEARAIRQPEELGEMLEIARALLAADHDEMLLVAVQPGHEHHPGLVEARRRREDVARQGNRRHQYFVVLGILILSKKSQSLRSSRRDRIENAQ